MSESIASRCSEIVWGIISGAFTYSNEHSASIPSTRSLRDYMEEQVKGKGLTKAVQRIVLQMAEMWGAFIGDPLERQSLKFFWLEECIEGGSSRSICHPLPTSPHGLSFTEPLQRIYSSPPPISPYSLTSAPPLSPIPPSTSPPKSPQSNPIPPRPNPIQTLKSQSLLPSVPATPSTKSS